VTVEYITRHIAGIQQASIDAAEYLRKLIVLIPSRDTHSPVVSGHLVFPPLLLGLTLTTQNPVYIKLNPAAFTAHGRCDFVEFT